MKYEVESELNPDYARTNRQSDYYGIYYVIAVAPSGSRRRLKSFSGKYANARANAYRYAAELLRRDFVERREAL